MKIVLVFLLMTIQSLYAVNYPVQLGDTQVMIHVERHGIGKSFIHLHQNETTALAAAKTMVDTQGGLLITLVHSGGRNIMFNLYNKHYEFDPNRIFTRLGIEKTLRQYSSYDPSAHKEIAKLAAAIKHLLPRGKIIAVHNNQQAYSLRSYLPGHRLAHDAQDLRVLDQKNYRNFYLVTNPDDFKRLIQQQFNSVLQAKNATDDGSLSIYLANRDYVNVEAKFGQLLQQINMLHHA
ncbi:MAG: protein tyrosine phosphatase [Legionella sp.]